jgi:hypothetical protein
VLKGNNHWRRRDFDGRAPALRQQIATDGHEPADDRADTVRNLDGWYQAFDVRPGQRLYLASASGDGRGPRAHSGHLPGSARRPVRNLHRRPRRCGSYSRPDRTP